MGFSLFRFEFLTVGVWTVLAHLNIPSMYVYGIFMIFNLQFYEYHKSDQLEKI